MRFTPVMGTGIVAVALLGLPGRPPGAEAVATAFWLLACALMALALVARDRIGPVTAWGAPPMALMTLAAGAQLLVSHRLALVLWTLGTLLGLVVAVVVPRRFRPPPEELTGVWLMPVVPPVVSAATGAALVPHPLCWALLGLGLALAAPTAVRVVRRVLREGAGPAAGVPALWIVLGPLGQSVTAVHHLDGPVVAYGVPVLGLALLWLGVAGAATLRAVRTTGLPFGPGWWAFTFPVGTVVTGTSGLADVTGSVVVADAAWLLFAGLVVAWAVVATRTYCSPGPVRSSDRTRDVPSAWNSVGSRGPRSAETSSW